MERVSPPIASTVRRLLVEAAARRAAWRGRSRRLEPPGGRGELYRSGANGSLPRRRTVCSTGRREVLRLPTRPGHASLPLRLMDASFNVRTVDLSAAKRRRASPAPGSFDPIHNGHRHHRAVPPDLRRVVVSQSHNEEKKALFSVEERVEMIRETVADFPDCRVEGFSGLLVDFMESVSGTTIVRGLRAVSDFEYEFQMALMNRRLDPRVETVFLTPPRRSTLCCVEPPGQGRCSSSAAT
ncbi:MAG: pantetheine-phosphate adenylyltransferase [Thermoanaerobaculia bacterium]